MTHKLIKTDNYLLVVDDLYIRDVRPFKGRWHLEHGRTLNMFPNYLTDLSLCKLVLAHLPLKGSPILEGVDLLPPYSRHQEDGVDELAQEWYDKGELTSAYSFKAGYNKAREKYKYTEEDMRKAIDMATTSKHDSTLIFFNAEEIIQSLHQYPTEFECEMEYDCCKRYVNCIGCDATEDMINLRPKTITTAQGVQWVGKYK